MRRIVAFIDADEDHLLAQYPEDGVGVAFEEKMRYLNSSGIHVIEWAISDVDDSEQYARYLHYLFGWTMDHVENFDELDSPMTYEQWQKCGMEGLR